MDTLVNPVNKNAKVHQLTVVHPQKFQSKSAPLLVVQPLK